MQCHLLVSHVPKILCDRTILLPSKPWLRKVGVQPLDNLRMTFYQPSRPLLLEQAKDRVIELFL
jgi:hypothetical protein